MKIGLETIFKFGKYKGRYFKWILINDLDYLRFLYRKGFYFEHNCVHLITKDFDIIDDITISVKSSKDEVIFFEEKYVILYPEKFIRKKTQKIVLSKTFIKKASIKHIPFEIKEREVEENHFDSSAFQSDDRFFTTTKIVKTKVYDKECLDSFIQSELPQVSEGKK